MRNIKKDRLFIFILFVAATFNFYGPFFHNIYESYGAIVLNTLVIITFLVIHGIRKVELRNYIWSVICILSIICSYIIIGGGLGSVLNNVFCVLYIFIFYEIRLSADDIKLFSKLFLFFHLYMIAYTIVNRYNNGYIGAYNANTIGMHSFFAVIIFSLIPRKNKFLAWAIIMSAILLLIYTKSRTSLLATIILVILLVFNRIKVIKPNFLKVCFWIMVVLGILVPIISVKLSTVTNNALMRNLWIQSQRLFNKAIFTGREQMWSRAIDQIFSNPLNLIFGIGSHYAIDYMVDSNFHSSFFTIIICCGFLGYVLIMNHLYHLYTNEFDPDNELYVRSRLIYLSVMVIGLFESTLFSGNFAILAYLTMYISSQRKGVSIKKHEHEKKVAY